MCRFLTNGTLATAHAALQSSGFMDAIDVTLSVEAVGALQARSARVRTATGALFGNRGSTHLRNIERLGRDPVPPSSGWRVAGAIARTPRRKPSVPLPCGSIRNLRELADISAGGVTREFDFIESVALAFGRSSPVVTCRAKTRQF